MAMDNVSFFDFSRRDAALCEAGLDTDIKTIRGDWKRDQLLFVEEDIQRAVAIVLASGVLDMLEQWREEDGALTNPRGAGCKPIFSPFTVLVVVVAFAIRKYPLYITDMARSFERGAWSKASLDMLGITPRMVRERNNGGIHKGRTEQQRQKRWYGPFWYQLSRGIMRYFDPYFDLPRHKRMKKTAFNAYQHAEMLLNNPRALALIDQQEGESITDACNRRRSKHMQRAFDFHNALLRASVALLGEEHLSQWDGTLIIDGTGIPVPGQGYRKKSSRVPTMPEAGYHGKKKDVDGELVDDPKERYWGMESHIATMGGSGFGGQGAYPGLAVAMSFDRPGVNPAGNARKLLDGFIADPEMPKGHLIVDRGYIPKARANELQIPARLGGYRINSDQPKNVTGFQHQFQSGVVQIDGQFFCPLVRFIPHFEDPWSAWLKGEISEEERDGILERRQELAMRPKGKPDENGNQTWRCPSQGEGATATCPFRTGAQRANPHGFQLDVALKNAQKAGAAIGNGPLKVCQNKESTTVPLVEVPAYSKRDQKRRERMTDEQKAAQDAERYHKALIPVKYQQQGPGWRTQAWQDIYGGRNGIEGFNEKAKHRRAGGLADVMCRLMRGYAAQMFYFTLGLVATNVHLIVGQGADDAFENGVDPEPPKPRKRRYSDDLEPEDKDLSWNGIEFLPPPGNAPPIAA